LNNNPIRFFVNEVFKEISLGEGTLQLRYAISNYGRLISFKEKFEEGRILKGGNIQGYRILHFKMYIDGKTVNRHFLFYKKVAEYFLPKKSVDQVHVLHLDWDKANDRVNNLKWATREEWLAHYRKNPNVIEARRKLMEDETLAGPRKLTSTQVMLLKKRLLDPNRKTRMKIIAKQYGVSEMQLYRIKSGENWGHIEVQTRKEK